MYLFFYAHLPQWNKCWINDWEFRVCIEGIIWTWGFILREASLECSEYMPKAELVLGIWPDLPQGIDL